MVSSSGLHFINLVLEDVYNFGIPVTLFINLENFRKIFAFCIEDLYNDFFLVIILSHCLSFMGFCYSNNEGLTTEIRRTVFLLAFAWGGV